ncbi:MAG TPA: ABC transporter ATP-binding protein [Candidatus Nanoarchaeia archaeon]|nr:ABC transporter ATP-binding protein [Candidatus Nanoarchaeia archaeon]
MKKKLLLSLRNVKRYFKLDERNIVKAVNGVNLDIYEGEFVTIFGPSGCGKSTLMHLIGLLDKPTEGRILINGRDTAYFKKKQLTRMRSESIGFVFQSFLLTPNLTAVENVEFPMVLVDKSESYRVNRARELLKNVGLGERLNHLPYQLSGGQKQRVAIARALSNNPSIILADEPTGNLDSTTGKDVINLFKELWKKGTTLVIVTHDPMLAKEAPRTIHILDGRVINDAHNEKIGGVSK